MSFNSKIILFKGKISEHVYVLELVKRQQRGSPVFCPSTLFICCSVNEDSP